MKKLLTLVFLLVSLTSLAQTKVGHTFYSDLFNTLHYGRETMWQTDHANIDTLTDVIEGTLAWDTINDVILYYNGTSWIDLVGSTSSPDTVWIRTATKIHPYVMTDSVGIGVTTPDEIADRLTVKGTVNFSNDSTLIQTGRISSTFSGFPSYVDGLSLSSTTGDTVNSISAGQLYYDSGSGYQFLDNISSIQNSYGNSVSAISATSDKAQIISSLNILTTEGQVSIEANKGVGAQIALKDTGLIFEVSDQSIAIDWFKINAADSTTTFKTLKSFTVNQPLLGENWLNWTTTAGGTTGQISSGSTMTVQSGAASVNISSGLAGYVNIDGAYNLPKTDGAAGAALTTDGAGQTYWKGGLGWVTYVDTTYPNSGAAWTLTGGVDTKLNFSWGTKNSTYLPAGIDSLFSRVDSTIIGIEGMGIDIMLYFKATPSAANQWLDIWIDIGGAVGELYRQSFSFPKGAGVERGVMYALPAAYTLNTWAANGGTIYVASDANLDIYGINLNINIDSRP